MNGEFSFSFCISDNYAQHLAVVIASILVNNPDEKFVFHVVHRNITSGTEARLRRLEQMYKNHRLVFHKVDESAIAGFKMPPTLAHVTVDAFLRYFLPDILKDEKRTVYSDVDVLCRMPLKGLKELDLDGKLIGMVRNRAGEKTAYREEVLAQFGFNPSSPYYFNGFLVMDLEGLREFDFVRKCRETTLATGGKLAFPDLDVINLVCEGRIKEISEIWNGVTGYNPLRRDVRIWHFVCQTQKPWCNLWKNITWIPYLKYLLKTPYKGNALRFVWGHVKGFFFFKYTKNRMTRYLVCGIRVWKRKAA